MKKTIIVMPVANEENTMGQILDEILALPYDNLYIYPVVDSYSKDRTEEIIREREKASDKVKCIFYQESTGVISLGRRLRMGQNRCWKWMAAEVICRRKYHSFLTDWKKGMTVSGDPGLWRAAP